MKIKEVLEIKNPQGHKVFRNDKGVGPTVKRPLTGHARPDTMPNVAGCRSRGAPPATRPFFSLVSPCRRGHRAPGEAPIPRRPPYPRTYSYQARAPPSGNPSAVRTSSIPATFWRAAGEVTRLSTEGEDGEVPHAMAQFQFQSSPSLHGSTPRGCFKH
jgi:hypothetical protein